MYLHACVSVAAAVVGVAVVAVAVGVGVTVAVRRDKDWSAVRFKDVKKEGTRGAAPGGAARSESGTTHGA